MTIGFDAKRIVRNGTGLGSYGRTLVNDLAARADKGLHLRLYTPDAGRDDLRRQVTEGPQLSFAYPTACTSALQKAWWRLHGVVGDLQRDGVRLYHGLSGELPIGLRRAGIRGVVTIHDLIFLRHPEYYHWIDTKLYAWKFRKTLQEADRIIAISQCTKRDIMELGGVSEERISVIYQSCNPRFAQPMEPGQLQAISQRYGLPARFVLNVGSIEERKNVLLAVRALEHLPAEVALVIVGRHTPYAEQVTRYAATHGLAARVCLLHGIDDPTLQALYQQAEAFVYPSRYEGFGIPIIEAIHSGLPVVACTGSCLEEAGGPDSLYVHPDDDAAMAQAISSVLRGADGREERIRRSRDYVRRFEGRDVAGQVANLYYQLLDL